MKATADNRRAMTPAAPLLPRPTTPATEDNKPSWWQRHDEGGGMRVEKPTSERALPHHPTSLVLFSKQATTAKANNAPTGKNGSHYSANTTLVIRTEETLSTLMITPYLWSNLLPSQVTVAEEPQDQ